MGEYNPKIEKNTLIGNVVKVIYNGNFLKIPKYMWEWLSHKFKKEYFDYDGKQYRKLFHWYNKTWRNERQIELPIFKEILDSGKDILEVGNVLPHYYNTNHIVIDKYESGEGIINKDVLEAEGKYDLIISISTLEHIGIDEPGEKDDKVLNAIRHLKSLLKDNGRLVFSFPRGHNHFLDTEASKSIYNLNWFKIKGKEIIIGEYKNEST
jgi:hypothetical protein